MTGEPDLVALLYRADWTRLSISAQVNDGSTVLVAPGRRYRKQTGDYVSGCDGDRPWMLPEDDQEAAEGRVHWISGPEPPFPAMLCPAWLLDGFRLEAQGQVSACGRDALHVVVTNRPGIRGRIWPVHRRADRVEVIVDTELGILLRVAWLADGEEPDVTELVSLEVNPAVDPAQFTPPPGSTIGESWREFFHGGGPAWWAAKTVGGLAAGGLGAWIRYSPLRRGESAAADTDDAETVIPRDDPAPGLSPDGWPSGPPVGDEVLRLLHRGGTDEFAATLHEWQDYGAMLSQIPAAGRRAGFGGLGLLADAISERPATAHVVSTLRLGGAGRYRIDRADEPRRGPKTVACDGQRCWKIYRDRVTVGPPAAPPHGIGDLADASWLLTCRLSGGEQVMADNRPAYRVSVARAEGVSAVALLFRTAVAVVDAELGILLRLTSWLGEEPVMRYELRDVTAGTGGGAGDFRPDLPPGLPTVEVTDPADEFRSATPPHPFDFPRKAAGAAARQAAREAAKAAGKLGKASGEAANAATEAAKAAREFLRRLDGR
jgi:hypothetical protein